MLKNKTKINYLKNCILEKPKKKFITNKEVEIL